MPVKKIFTLLLTCLPLLLSAQNKHGQALIDSLLHELPKQKEDTNKVNVLHTLAFNYLDNGPDEGLKYGNTGLKLSEQLGYKKGTASLYNIIGRIYAMKGNIAEGLATETKALNLFEEINNKAGIGRCYIAIGIIYLNQCNYPEALKKYLAALKIFEELGDKPNVATCYNNIGTVYNGQGNNREALKNLTECVRISNEIGMRHTSATALLNMTRIYMNEGKMDEALKTTLTARIINEEIGNKLGVANCYSQTARIYLAQKNYSETLKNCYASLKIWENFGAGKDLAFILEVTGDALRHQKKYNEAEKYYRRTLLLAERIGSLNNIEYTNKDLSAMYEQAGKYKKALSTYKAYIVARDSTFNEENTKKIVRTQMQYDFDKKESAAKGEQLKKDAAHNLQLQQKNIFIYGTLAAIAALLVIGGLLIRQSKLKANHLRIELEQKQLRAQMNPHFIFNCLNSIQHFVVTNDVKNANKYLSGFALLMRQTLENSKEGTIRLRDELAYLENYLALELMRFEDKFTYKINCPDNINTDSIEIPSMIIQPFIENAIRHGLCYLRDKEGKLTVRFYREGGYLFCEIDDNGIGREQSQKLKMGSDLNYQSQGMDLTRQRLALVSKSSGTDYEITVTDKKNSLNKSEGTTIIIKFPITT